jgi:cell filamentation protein, protein adenylyltransferase
MDDRDFQSPKSPGRLEPTTFVERVLEPSGRLLSREVAGRGFVPDPLPAGLTRKEVLLEAHDHILEAERSLSALEGMAGRLKDPSVLMQPFARKEARHSSAIENTFASEEQLALFGVDETAVEPSQREDVQEVRNYFNALQHGFRDNRPLRLNLIKEMHERLLQGVTRSAGTPGRFRTTQNAIGSKQSSFKSARFVPPPPRYLDELLTQMERYMNATNGLPRLVRFALTHYQFECIHPFDDGNGRLGRLMIALQLCKQGQLERPLVYVSGFFERHRHDYYDLLYRVSTEGAWIEWIQFFLTAIASQAKDALQRAKHLDRLREDFHARVRKKRASAMLPKVIDELFTSPAINVAIVQQVTRMAAPSAGNLVKRLEEVGILHEVTNRKRNRVFVASEIVLAMNADLEPGD